MSPRNEENNIESHNTEDNNESTNTAQNENGNNSNSSILARRVEIVQQEHLERRFKTYRIRVGVGFPSLTHNIVKVTKLTKHLTIFICGERFNGEVVGKILQLASEGRRMESVSILRKDNEYHDTPNPNLYLSPNDDEILANCIRNHATLRQVTITGLMKTSCITNLSLALCTIPQLSELKLQIETVQTTATRTRTSTAKSAQQGEKQQQQQVSSSSEAAASFPPKALELLLNSSSKLTKLSLLNVIPEKKYPYLQLLEDAYLRDCCTVQLALDFSDTKVLSGYSCYLRDIMELNQNGRAELRNAENNNLSSNDVTKLLVSLFHHAIDGKPQQQKQRSNNNDNTSIISKIGSSITRNISPQVGKRCKSLSVMDSVYLLVRESPWICSSAAVAIPTTPPTTTPIRREKFRNLQQKVNSSFQERPDFADFWSTGKTDILSRLNLCLSVILPKDPTLPKMINDDDSQQLSIYPCIGPDPEPHVGTIPGALPGSGLRPIQGYPGYQQSVDKSTVPSINRQAVDEEWYTIEF